MTTKRELVARIADLSESLSAKSQLDPDDFVMETELTFPQMRTLYFLLDGPMRITDLAQIHGMARPNASNMVERLVRKGLVERVPDPNDRRVALASLTNEGRQAVEALTSGNYAAIEKIATVLSIDELEVVVRALEILDRGAERLEASGEDAVSAQGIGTIDGAGICGNPLH